MQAEESVGTVRALKQIVQDHRRLFGIKLTEPATTDSKRKQFHHKSNHLNSDEVEFGQHLASFADTRTPIEVTRAKDMRKPQAEEQRQH
jgi:hypothetical protein